jgi:hypothetical protein
MEKITRSKIYDMPYWKERCFGVSAEVGLYKLSSVGPQARKRKRRFQSNP